MADPGDANGAGSLPPQPFADHDSNTPGSRQLFENSGLHELRSTVVYACLSLSSGFTIAPVYGDRLELPAGWPVRMRFFQSRSGRGMV